MYQKIITIIRKEVLRLINEQIYGIFMTILQTPNLLLNQNQQGTLNDELIKQWTEVANDEEYKVKHSEVTFVVIGTMKSGKSTTINAIVGNELLPNRNQPMTILPTIIRHSAGKIEPELTFSNPHPFNELLEILHQKLKVKESKGELHQIPFCTTTDGKELIQKILARSWGKIGQHYQGSEEIFVFLKYVNDIWRLCNTDTIAIDITMYLDYYHKIQDLPAIEVDFFHLRGQNHEGSFALIDTPGPNEAGQDFLKNIIMNQLEKASAVIVVLDYTQMNAEAEVEIRNSLQEILHITGNRLFVLVNKFDQKDRNGMSVESLRSYVATQLFEGRVEKERIFPVSSKYAYLANRALSELLVNGKLSDYRINPWVEDFGQLALGACWEMEIDDAHEVENRAIKLWQKSLFDHPLAEVIKNGSQNATLISLKSAIGKMLLYDNKVIENLQLRVNALTIDINVIENHINCLAEDINTIKSVHDGLRIIIMRGIDTLQDNFYTLFDENSALLKEEIEIEFHLNNYEDFATEEDAQKLLIKLAEIVASKLQLIQITAKKNVDEVLEKIWREVTIPLETLLKTVGERFYDSFAVTPNFPKPTIFTEFDSDRIFPSSIKKESITKIGTMLERRWYTLWSHDHELTYQYWTHVYRIYRKDVFALLQKLFIDDSNGIWLSLDHYVRTEFNEAIKTYFMDIFHHLEQLKGDLQIAKQDQELKSEGMENLQIAMLQLLKTSIIHRRDVELLGKGLLIRCNKEKMAV